LSAPRTGRLFPQEMFLVRIVTRGLVDPRAMVKSYSRLHLNLVEDFSLLGCDGVWAKELLRTFRKIVTPLPSCSKSPTNSLMRLHDPEYDDTVVYETSRASRPTTLRLIPEDTNLQPRRWEKLRSCT